MDLRERPSHPAGGLRRRFFRLVLLNILSNLTVPLAGLVDTALLGHLAEIRFLAGVALATVAFDFLYWSFGFLRMGTTGTTAQAAGRGDVEEIHRVLHRSFAVALALGGALVVLREPLGELIFWLLDGTPEVEAAGRAYFTARIWAAPFTLANFALLGWFLGRERSGVVLAMTVAANLANVLLDWLFIVGLGLAAFGAGLATALGQVAMLGVALVCLTRLGEGRRWEWNTLNARRPWRGLLRLNADLLLRTVALVASFALFTNFSASLGTTVLAANALLLRLVGLNSYLVDGVAFATESLAGVFRGARDPRSLRRLVRLAMATAYGLTAPLLALIAAFPTGLLGLLASDAPTVALAARHALWLIPVFLLGSAAYVWDGLFLGLTAGRLLRNSMLASLLLGFLPLALAARWTDRNDLLWLALAAFMALRCATLGWAARAVAAAATSKGSPS